MRKKEKMVRFAYCNRIFMCILCTGSGCVQASQITGKKHTACKQQWEKVQLRGISTHGLSWYPEYVNQSAFTFMKKTGR